MQREPLELAMSLGVDYETALELRNMINADWTGWRDLWLERLSDPGWRGRVPECVAQYLDVPWVEHSIATWERLSNPNDPDTIRLRRFMEACDAGGPSVKVDLTTGEETHRWYPPNDPEGVDSHSN